MIDLHAHSTVSDGTFSPKELVSEAKRIGLTAVAITDHDSIDGHKEAEEQADAIGMTLIKGIEFSTSFGEGRLIHILGIGIDAECEGFMRPYLNYRKTRESKLGLVFEELQKMGLDISPEKVMPYRQGDYLDRQAIAKWIVANGHAPIMKNAWIDWIDHIPYQEGELIEAKTAIDAIHAAGGKAFMAHFHMPIGLKGYSEAESRRKLALLKEYGLDGLEYYYPTYTDEDRI